MKSTFREKILKSFEIFRSEHINIFKNKIVNIISLKTNLTDNADVSVELLRDSLQINVVNSDNMYNLLKSTIYKRKKIEEEKAKLEVDNNIKLLGVKNEVS